MHRRALVNASARCAHIHSLPLSRALLISYMDGVNKSLTFRRFVYSHFSPHFFYLRLSSSNWNIIMVIFRIMLHLSIPRNVHNNIDCVKQRANGEERERLEKADKHAIACWRASFSSHLIYAILPRRRRRLGGQRLFSSLVFSRWEMWDVLGRFAEIS